ncbi:hypothetical protein [Bacteroides sp.]|nr:hypothetical protein [Bacteroides sp.]
MKLLTPLQAVSKQTGLKKEPKGIYVKIGLSERGKSATWRA